MKKKKYFAEFSFQKLMCLHIHNWIIFMIENIFFFVFTFYEI